MVPALPDEPPDPQSPSGLQIDHNSFLIHTLVITGLDPVIHATTERRVDGRIKSIKSGHDEDGWLASVGQLRLADLEDMKPAVCRPGDDQVVASEGDTGYRSVGTIFGEASASRQIPQPYGVVI
jgi:hypothetical protein